MDISSRNVNSPAGPGGHNLVSNTASTGKKSKAESKWGRIGFVAAAIAIAVIISGVALVAANTGSKAEASYVDTSKLQAVFLNTGQVYFGNVKQLNSKYLTLTNIYYLQTSSSSDNNSNSSNASVTLVKLGCELHEPYDQMVINRDQVTFWENLQDGGQVAKAVANFKQQNPNGQKCTDQSSSASTNSANTTQNAASGNADTSTSTTPNSSSSNSSSNKTNQ